MRIDTSKTIVILFLLTFVSVFADFTDFNLIDETQYDLNHLIYNSDFITKPLTMLSGMSLLFDEHINKAIPKSSFLNVLDNFDTLEFSLLALTTALIIYPFDNYTAFTVVESFTVSAGVTALIKIFVGRARPYNNLGAFVFEPFNLNRDYQSFPSGHSALSWAIFTPVAKRFGDIWYAIPVVFSLQRVWSNNHWFSDVLFGASIGYNIGSQFYDARKGE